MSEFNAVSPGACGSAEKPGMNQALKFRPAVPASVFIATFRIFFLFYIDNNAR